MDKHELREEIRRRKKDGWIEAWFAIEALAVREDVVKSSLEEHIEKLRKLKDAFVYEASFNDIIKVEKPLKKVETAYSQVVEVRLFVKDFYTLVGVIILYGPSSIEILGPDVKSIKISEMQSLANSIATLVHQFASAGIGGIVMTPDKKPGEPPESRGK